MFGKGGKLEGRECLSICFEVLNTASACFAAVPPQICTWVMIREFEPCCPAILRS